MGSMHFEIMYNKNAFQLKTYHVTHRSQNILNRLTFMSFEIDMAFTFHDNDLQALVEYMHVIEFYVYYEILFI